LCLPGGVVKSLSYKQRITQNADLLPFDMPVLKSDFSVGRSADHIEREAYEKAFAAGEKAGFEMGEQKAQVLIEKVEALINELATLKQRIAKEVEPQCVELAVSIARKIIIKELTVKPEEIIRMVKEALLKLERTGQVTIKVNPALYDFFTRHKPDIVKIHPDIVIDADPSVSRFGTVVMGPVEDVVTDLDEQLKNLIKDLGDHYARD
jgi:flagellar assembly protein FliH